jgi:prenyltransferase beta subunit
MYWCIASLDLCNALEGQDLDLVIKLIQESKNSDGGYACAPGSDSHVLHTLCAIQVTQ